nr:zf-CCHC domain-containing protein/UBN2 domain-containing protein [Tanacetum cinerariifolium]
MESVKETIKIRACKGDAWERVDVSKMLEIDANSGFMVTYDNDIVEVTMIEESKYLSSLALDEIIGNLKVHEVVMKKDFEIYKGKNEKVKYIALKAKKESSDDETLISRSKDEEYVMVVRNFKKIFKRKGRFVRQPREEKKSFRQRDDKKGKRDKKCFTCCDLTHLIGELLKPP